MSRFRNMVELDGICVLLRLAVMTQAMADCLCACGSQAQDCGRQKERQTATAVAAV